MLITVLVFPTFVAGLIFMIILSILVITAGIALQRMPDNENENGNTGNSWTGPERGSYIAVIVTWVLFTASSLLLVNGEVLAIALGIGLVVFCLLVLTTGSILAFAVMSQKRATINALKKILPTTIR